MSDKKSAKKPTADPTPTESPLKLRKPKKLEASKALQDLVEKKKVLPACESSSACSRKGRKTK